LLRSVVRLRSSQVRALVFRVPFLFTQAAPGALGLDLALLLSVLFSVLFLLLFLRERAESVVCRYAEPAARLLPVPLLRGPGWASRR
jgi:hypothetical protein